MQFPTPAACGSGATTQAFVAEGSASGEIHGHCRRPDHLAGETQNRVLTVKQARIYTGADTPARIDRDPGATLEQIESARGEGSPCAPLLMVAVACLGEREPDTPALERMISMGAAIQNILLGAHAMGFGRGLTSGQAMDSPRLRDLCGLRPGEAAVCCVNIGTVAKRRRAARVRPVPEMFTSALCEPAPARRSQ